MTSWAPVVDQLRVVDKPQSAREREMSALFEQHYDGLCDLATMILGDPSTAEEVVMEALLKTFTGWGRIRDKARVNIYLKRAVINLCRSRIRRKIIEARVNAVAYRRDEMRPAPWTVDTHETAREVWRAVRELPTRQRACIYLRYVEDLPEGDIAEIMDCSVGTVRSQLSRARAKLEARLTSDENARPFR
jgi:RNA polymerase sigma-70 factor (sigma-E family)